MSKNIKFLTVAILVIAVVGAYKFPKSTIVEQTSLGAVTAPVLTSPSWTVNGVEHQYLAQTLNGATTTCSWKNGGATSTLLFAGFQINTATNTALFLTLATSTAPNATTSLLLPERSLAANVKTSYYYKGTTTPTIGAADGTQIDLIAPNTYVTWGVEGSAGFTVPSAFGATCKFEAITN